LKTLKNHGSKATYKQAGVDFRDSKYRLWHANMAARTNLRAGIMPPQSGHPRYNPHADDIDFQIEADVFGLIAPGQFRAAARMCDVFGSIMNYGDGLYGGRFVAGMYCQAYLEKEATPAAVRRCLDAGLAMIPAKSTYAQIVRDVIDSHHRYPDDWLKTWHTIQDKWGEIDTCPDGYKRPFNIDAKLNGAYIALGLLYGNADFEKTCEITTRCGQDADCNPSNAAGVLGTLLGYSRIPKMFTEGIPTLTGQKFEYTDYDYPQLLAACEKVTRKLIRENGGKITTTAAGERIEFPVQKPEAPAKLEQMLDFGMPQLQEWGREFDRRLVQVTFSKPWQGWMVADCGTDMEPGVREFNGLPDVLITHPIDRNAPAALVRSVTLPAGRPSLHLKVAAWTEAGADWELRVLVDGKRVEQKVIRSADRWQDVVVDLSPYAGKTVKLRLENASGGASPWAWEAGCWARAEIRAE
jgi:hypothetical protein